MRVRGTKRGTYLLAKPKNKPGLPLSGKPGKVEEFRNTGKVREKLWNFVENTRKFGKLSILPYSVASCNFS